MPENAPWSARARRELDAIRAAQRWRETAAFDAYGPVGRRGDRELVSFAGNDYLGLTVHPAVTAAAREATARWGTGTGASRLVTGGRNLHDELEAEIADWTGCDKALLFSSGFAANLGVLSVLGRADVTIFSDSLNHASIIDGCRLARARAVVYRHGDVDHLAELLTAATGPSIVVTDTVFSMDGDIAPVDDIARLCAAHQALLITDEAHAVLGPAAPAVQGVENVRVGTLSKSLAAIGGWVAGPRALIELLVNEARPFIYSTALPPGDTAAALAALRIYKGQEGDMLRRQLRSAIDRFRPRHPSPIIPIMLGDDADALAAARALQEHGLHIPAIRPPTVPVGTARLRLTLSAAHSERMLDQLAAGLTAVGLDVGTTTGAGGALKRRETSKRQERA